MHDKYKCPNGCCLPRRQKTLVRDRDKWKFDYPDYIYCPCCGAMMPPTLDAVKRFFKVFHLNTELAIAERLLYKSEYISAAREAFVVVESVIRRKTGLDLHGVDLVTKALNFKTDKQTGIVSSPPLLAVNNLKIESEKNEQEGMMHVLMGFFIGRRNIYQHNHVGAGVSSTIATIIEASFILDVLEGHSITKHGKWIPQSVNYSQIYKNMPRLRDSIRFLYRLKEIKGKINIRERKR